MGRPRVLRLLPFVCAVAPFVVGAAIADPAQAKKAPVFEGDVQTVLRAHCGTCHSGQDKSADLDLTTLEGVMKGGISGKAVVPGSADKSLLVMRLEGKGGKSQMPLGFKPLAPEKIAAIKAWINGGCKSTGAQGTHWAYVAPKLPKVPRVTDGQWPRNTIDSFILAKLESQKIRPSKEASKQTLIRRLYLDLTGLPPTPAEVASFVEDKSPKAYENIVDKLLASPAYGERMARPWLDLARYADSDGYEKDLNRTAWKYRDWVIDAFNKNKPYDQFTLEQLAGDMLPNASLEQMVATGFNRNSMFNSEGGVDPAEAQFNVVLDRVNTVSTVWLGSTVQCARCHNHKYDPFTQKDFYKLYAVFNNTEYTSNGDYKKGQENWYEPTIEVPSPEQQAKKAALLAEIGTLDAALKNPGASVLSSFETWLKAAGKSEDWIMPKAVTAKAESGQILALQSDGSFLAGGKAPANDVYTIDLGEPVKSITGVRVEVLPDPSLPNNGPGRASSGNFILTKVELLADDRPVALARATVAFSQEGYDAQRTINSDGKNGWAIYPTNGQANEILIEPTASVDATIGLRVKLYFESKEWPEHEIGRFRVTLANRKNPRVLPIAIKSLLSDPAKIEANKPALLAEFVKSHPDSRPQAEKLSALKNDLRMLERQVPTALVIKEKKGGSVKANIHIRGEFLQKGDEVAAGPPDCVGPRPGPAPFNRLALAQWLTSRQNPLASRVEVNRLWEMVFGRGIVETSEDFGTQGSKPSHPELLDWLAVTFMDGGWDIKALMKMIVMSATYRQSSDASKELIEKDPQNILLARAPRFRMEAESVRDNMLSIGGVLSLKIGGPSVYPSQPPAIWDTPYNGEQWMTSQGIDKYRRGLYTFWKRSSPYPSFVAMDATSRETCTVRRLRTNTPLQALALLNDDVTMDAAKGLAKRMQDEGGRTIEDQIKFAFTACTGRSPEQQELQRLTRLYEKLSAHYSADDTATKKLAPSPKEAAYVLVCNTLLNLDETMTRS